MIGGIYSLCNTKTGDIYVGQTVNFSRRKYEHFESLLRKDHFNSHLQRSFDKYGSKYFTFNILIYCEKFELTRYEQKLVDLLNPEFNIRQECVTSSKGIIQSKEFKEKQSIAHTGKKASDKTKKKMSVARKGKKINVSPKSLSNLANARDKACSSESRKKNSDSNKGKSKSDEHRKKISESMKLHFKNIKMEQ